MKRTVATPEPAPQQHHTCQCGLEPDYACRCLALDLDERNQPAVCWLASRPLKAGSKITYEKKHRYIKAVREVERLNRLHRGETRYFLLPVS